MKKSIGDIGERDMIREIRKVYGYPWPDDDCAYIENGSEYLLLTTDSVSSSSHIPKGASLEKAGYFFAAVNLSDIAAMGGRPEYFMAALALPRGMAAGELIKIERGIEKCLSKYKVRMIGGDLKPGRELRMTGIAIGSVDKRRCMKRSGVRPGDLVCVTGMLGRNAAGYYLWKKTKAIKWAELLLDVEPKIVEGMAIAKAGARAAMDLSDGLYGAISELNSLTGHGFEIDFEKVPIDPIAISAARKLGLKIERLALEFGGEYELLFTIPRNKLEKLNSISREMGFKVAVVGRVKGKNNILIREGKKIGIRSAGYEHFKAKR